MSKAPGELLDFIRVVVAGDIAGASRRLATDPVLATAQATTGATRACATDFFFPEIAHYLYAGDTALHLAAAAFRRELAELLVAHGASWRTRNRRGAQPLHYAADTNHWRPAAQAEIIAYLLSIGADPNCVDQSGVAPLHRAVRTRSAPAVRALLEGGASPTAPNGAGTTPLQLANQTTGRGGSGSPRAREQQAEILRLSESGPSRRGRRNGIKLSEQRGNLIADFADGADKERMNAPRGFRRAGTRVARAHLRGLPAGLPVTC